MPRAVGALPRAQHQPLGRLGGAVALAVVFLGSLTPGFSRSLQTPRSRAPIRKQARFPHKIYDCAIYYLARLDLNEHFRGRMRC
jgi:hypothetical protein